jgi:hypothetical protein
MKDVKGNIISTGDNIKYSFNDFGFPTFTGRIIEDCEELYIEHSNKIKVKLDETIKYIEIVPYDLYTL